MGVFTKGLGFSPPTRGEKYLEIYIGVFNSGLESAAKCQVSL